MPCCIYNMVDVPKWLCFIVGKKFLNFCEGNIVRMLRIVLFLS